MSDLSDWNPDPLLTGTNAEARDDLVAPLGPSDRADDGDTPETPDPEIV